MSPLTLHYIVPLEPLSIEQNLYNLEDISSHIK